MVPTGPCRLTDAFVLPLQLDDIHPPTFYTEDRDANVFLATGLRSPTVSAALDPENSLILPPLRMVVCANYHLVISAGYGA